MVSTLNPRFCYRNALLAGTALLAQVITTGTVNAAEPSPQSSEAQPAQPAQIDDIVVTARRTEEAAQTVPAALTALSQSLLQQRAVLDIRDLQTATPGLFIGTDTAGGNPTFAIRGAKSDVGTSPTVAVYIDDVPVVSTSSIANMVYDMQSVTTLKGPQGTLFGANSTGGAIIFRPNKPTDRLEGYVMAGLGNYSRREFQAMLNVPVSELLELRIAGEVVRRDGFFRNVSPLARRESARMSDDRHESARLSVRLHLSDTITNDTVVDFYHVDNQPKSLWGAFYRPRFDFGTFLGFSVPVDFAKAGIKPLPRFQVQTSGDRFYNKSTFYGFSNTTDWDIAPDWSFKTVIGYRNDDNDVSESQISALQYTPTEGRSRYRTEQWTVEPSTNFSWGDGRWSNKLGLFLSHSTNQRNYSFRVLGLPFDLTGVDPVTAGLVNAFYPVQSNVGERRIFKSAAVYDQLSLELSDELTVRAGLRYTHDSARITVTNRTAFPMTSPAGVGEFGDYDYGPCDAGTAAYEDFDPVSCTGNRSFKKNSTSFSLSLENKFANRKMLYASLRGGYLVGGFNNPVPERDGQVFGPERVVAFEGGLKADWDVTDRPLRTNVAIFYGTYEGQQRISYQLGETGTGYVAVQNAGSTRFYGADADFTFKPADFITLNASYQYLVAEYTNYNAALSVPFITAALDLSGVQESQAPKHIVSASATVDIPIPEAMGGLSATLSYFYRSKSLGRDAPTIGGSCADGSSVCTAPGTFIPDASQDFTKYDALPSFGVFDLSVQWKSVGGSAIDADLFIKNLTDKSYITASNNQALTYGWATFQLGDPRTVGARLRYSF